MALYLRDGESRPAYLSEHFKIRGQFHGSPVRFASFNADELKSLGFHFGDIAQARHFSGKAGYIYKADLTFNRILDIEDDWGWTSAPLLAFALHSQCFMRRIPVKCRDFEQILGPAPWSSLALPRRRGISADEQKILRQLFRDHGFDGVRYPNQFEPHGSLRRIAYFVTEPAQIEVREVRDANEFNFPGM